MQLPRLGTGLLCMNTFATSMNRWVLPFFLVVAGTAAAQWTPLGSDLIGAAGEQFGFVTDLNAAGNRLAVGAPWSNPNGTRSGMVRVYEFDGTNWVPMGTELLGDTTENEFGSALKLSADGNTLAVGAPERWVGPASPPGYVRVFDWDGTAWVPRGEDLSAGVSADGFGTALDISGSGDLIAIGAPYEATVADWAGRVSVWQWTGTLWELHGSPVLGTEMFSGTGGAVALNDAGTLLAVGQEGESRVVVMDWDGENWTPKDTLWGNQAFGNSMSMDASGMTLAVGGESLSVSNGRVKVFTFNGSDYVPKGGNIDGQGDDLFLGYEPHALKLREDGEFLVAGSLGNIIENQVHGRVRMFQFDGQNWVHSAEIPGAGITEQFGRSVSMNADGTVLAIGTPYTNDLVLDAGIVRVYAQTAPAEIATARPNAISLAAFPNPARASICLKSAQQILRYTILSSSGQMLVDQTISPTHECHIDLTQWAPGTYFLHTTTAQSTLTTPILRVAD